MTRKPYPSDLSDAEWSKLDALLPTGNSTGSPCEVELREVLNALISIANNGIKWRALSHDFPAWQTVYGYFRCWSGVGGVGADLYSFGPANTLASTPE